MGVKDYQNETYSKISPIALKKILKPNKILFNYIKLLKTHRINSKKKRISISTFYHTRGIRRISSTGAYGTKRKSFNR